MGLALTTSHSPVPPPAIMRALGDPTRCGLYEEIVRAGEITVADLTRRAVISQPAVSQHIRTLREAGLLAERREGRNTWYRADPAGLEPLVDWFDHYAAFWRSRFGALKTLLKEIDSK